MTAKKLGKCKTDAAQASQNKAVQDKAEADSEPSYQRGTANKSPAQGEDVSLDRIPTWRICLFAGGIVVAVALICVVIGWTHLAGAIVGCGALCIGIYAIFREEPPLREHPGNGGNIDFGVRNEIHLPSNSSAASAKAAKKREPKPKRSLKQVFKDKTS